MPELPEVETVRAQLDEVLQGQVIEDVQVRREKSFSGSVNKILGRKILSVNRKGKMLYVELGREQKTVNKKQKTIKRKNDRHYLMIHLKMTGQLIFDSGKQVTSNKKQDSRIVGGHPSASWVHKLPDRHTRVVFTLSGGMLYFNDMRVFGWVRSVTSNKLQETRNKMPPDIVDREMGRDKFYEILQRTMRPIKVVVMDSQKIGGVGNIYACDGLNLARIDPRRPANELKRVESDRLLDALKERVELGIKLGGASVSNYVQASGMGGSYQEKMLVYNREGEGCPNGTGVIEKTKVGGRGTYWCPKCQS